MLSQVVLETCSILYIYGAIYLKVYMYVHYSLFKTFKGAKVSVA